MKKRLFALFLCLSLVFGLIPGCGSTSEETTADATTSMEEHITTGSTSEEESTTENEDGVTEENDQEDSVVEEDPEEEESVYTYSLPLFEEQKTFTMWKSLNATLLSTCMTNGYIDNYAYQKSLELTNVAIEFITYSSNSATEQLDIMLASGSYPDMIANLSASTNYSFDELIDQEILIDLYPYVEEYMPVYKSILDSEGETFYLEILTEAGQMGATYSVQVESDDPIYGLAIRQDWLDQLGLEVPTTYDEMYDVAMAFKTELGATEAIHYLGLYDFCEGFGTLGYNVNFNPFASQYQGFYQVDGVVKFGLVEDAYKTYIETMAQWYADGLIAQEFYTTNQSRTSSEAEVARMGETCGIFGMDPNNLDYYESNAENPDYELTAMAYVTEVAGDTIHLAEYSSYTSPVISVTTACEDVASVVKWLDWWYTDEGSDLANYGVEGLTMEYDENGEPYYTELYTENDGSLISDDEFPQLYFFQVVGNVTIPDGVKSFYSDKAKSFPSVWTSNQDSDWSLPEISLSQEESEIFSSTFGDISTLFAEYLPQFVTGDRPLSEWDSFVEILYEMGIEDCIACWQGALDRYYDKLS